MKTVFTALRSRLEAGQNSILVAIAEKSGSAPRGVGTVMLAGEAGLVSGTVGGGSVEYHALKDAAALLEEKRSDFRKYLLHIHQGEDIGMICGGQVGLWFQYIPGDSDHWKSLTEEVLRRITAHIGGVLMLPKAEVADRAAQDGVCIPLPKNNRAILFGGGHVSQALVPVLRMVDFCPIVVENREEFASPDLFPQAEQVILGDYSNISASVTITKEDFVLVMTSGHSSDYEIQLQVLRGEFAYLGVIGSRKKTAALRERLLAAGISEAQLQEVHAPIGTPIRAVTPSEIAISIAGEMISVRAEREGAEKASGCPMAQ